MLLGTAGEGRTEIFSLPGNLKADPIQGTVTSCWWKGHRETKQPYKRACTAKGLGLNQMLGLPEGRPTARIPTSHLRPCDTGDPWFAIKNSVFWESGQELP